MLGTLVTGFLAGFGAYDAILRISERTTVSRERLAQLEDIQRGAKPVTDSDEATMKLGAADAEKLVTEWVGALMAQDLDAIVRESDIPFYCEKQIFVQRTDIRKAFGQLFAEKPRISENFGQIESLKVKTVGDLKREGFDARRDRVLKNLEMNEDDYVGIVTVGRAGTNAAESMLLFLRKKADGFKVVGTWD